MRANVTVVFVFFLKGHLFCFGKNNIFGCLFLFAQNFDQWMVSILQLQEFSLRKQTPVEDSFTIAARLSFLG
jgi:hypothetical protein